VGIDARIAGGCLRVAVLRIEHRAQQSLGPLPFTSAGEARRIVPHRLLETDDHAFRRQAVAPGIGDECRDGATERRRGTGISAAGELASDDVERLDRRNDFW